jgi:acetyltransferase-like isoleucine patch superfamily enzyme
MQKIRHRVIRGINIARAAFKFGPRAAARLVACGPGMSVMIERGSSLVVQARVTFGRRCGISVAPVGDVQAARLTIGRNASFQDGLGINCGAEIEIGSDCLVSWDVHIMDTDFHQIVHLGGQRPNKCRPIKIGDRVWIGARATILKGAQIGSDSVVAAGSVVTKSFPPRSLIAGNPARFMKQIDGWHV